MIHTWLVELVLSVQWWYMCVFRLKSKVASALGLVALHEKNYYAAASKFIECSAEIGASYNEVLHAEDIALYGGICALASFERKELKEKVINNSSFKAFLELLPWLRELITDFNSSNYALCLQTLERRKVCWSLDVAIATAAFGLTLCLLDAAGSLSSSSTCTCVSTWISCARRSEVAESFSTFTHTSPWTCTRWLARSTQQQRTLRKSCAS